MEEVKREKRKIDFRDLRKTMLKIVLGVIFIAIGICGICFFWPEVLTLIKGCIVMAFLLAGLICFAIVKE